MIEDRSRIDFIHLGKVKTAVYLLHQRLRLEFRWRTLWLCEGTLIGVHVLGVENY
jgi:hypothetical protein